MEEMKKEMDECAAECAGFLKSREVRKEWNKHMSRNTSKQLKIGIKIYMC